ncbi:glycoside hydrolase family 65 protein [Bacillus marinisedimentorum]|uniref:glycoside hydrolase family 65 protein n=1 Tax=Bacillus marinisedimentorum TaxID=1821260 RepID=UPI0008728A52|nr:glycosyl hydrolase family 65 protein [Bacillus marinisedimentorum]
MTWTLTNNERTKEELLNLESLFALGNGYLGVRGNFEEGYGGGMASIRGTYQNAFHDIIDIPYGEKLYGFPDTQQKMLNVIDAQTIELYFGEGGEEERFSLFEGEILSYERNLHLDRGYAERAVHWKSPGGKELNIRFRRLVSFATRELFAVETIVEPVNFNGQLRVVSTVDGDVSNFTDDSDPRVGSGHARRLHPIGADHDHEYSYVVSQAEVSRLETACVSRLKTDTGNHVSIRKSAAAVETILTMTVTEEPITITKYNVYTDSLRHETDLVQKGIDVHRNISMLSFNDLLIQQRTYLEAFWKDADITIDGDEKLQEGIRFNLYQLLQSAGGDKFSNISAKGLSGEGYEGHYFWDTEIYMFPVFLMTRPDIARQLLIYRYSILEQAREHAREMGHKKGALFPWRTISGTECSSYFPSGSAQYHISGDIAYSYVQYLLASGDEKFLKQYGAEVLFETARLWMDTGHYHNGKFRIDDVTGPDEYTCIVNNNYYTNVMAKHNLKWAAKAYRMLEEMDRAAHENLSSRLRVTAEEAKEWKAASEAMYLPFDEERGINPQDDTFLQKAVWDFEHTPKEHRPLLLHYHPLTLYRYQVCKQADTVLAHFLLEDEESFETIKRSYDYYEKITTHDSSLSSCIFSIMASKVGYRQKAFDYFIETARLDLDNTHGNTKDGLHMANMGGTWMSIVYGFAGLRLTESGLSLAPALPEEWQHYRFRLQYRSRTVEVDVNRERVSLRLVDGRKLEMKLYGEKVALEKNSAFTAELMP